MVNLIEFLRFLDPKRKIINIPEMWEIRIVWMKQYKIILMIANQS